MLSAVFDALAVFVTFVWGACLQVGWCEVSPSPTVQVAAPAPLSSRQLLTRAKRFARAGGGEIHVYAIAAHEQPGAYVFHHWGGFWMTAPLDQAGSSVARPSPPLLLVTNHPYSRESDDQNVAEEIVLWRDDGSFAATGVRYSKWGGGMSSERFGAAAAKLLRTFP